jgi:hypothetical protein
MQTPPLASVLFKRLAGIVSVFLLLILFAGCDSGGGLDESDDPTITADETAESIAYALAESTGGTADELGDAAAIAGGAGSSKAKDVSRTITRTYDDSERVWTYTVEVSGSRARIDTVNFSRSYRVQFFAGNEAVRLPADADSMTFDVVEGRGLFQTSRIDNSHELVPATWALSEAPNEERRITLLSAEAGRDVTEQFTGARRSRSREATVRKTRVEGLVHREGDGLVAGTIEGTYDADVEIERADGRTVSRSVSVTYVATFSEDGAEITFTGGGERFSGDTFTFDQTTGELE